MAECICGHAVTLHLGDKCAGEVPGINCPCMGFQAAPREPADPPRSFTPEQVELANRLDGFAADLASAFLCGWPPVLAGSGGPLLDRVDDIRLAARLLRQPPAPHQRAKQPTCNCANGVHWSLCPNAAQPPAERETPAVKSNTEGDR